MISPLAQLLIVTGRINQYPEPEMEKKSVTLTPNPYRQRCNACDALNRDARLSCEGHAPVSVL